MASETKLKMRQNLWLLKPLKVRKKSFFFKFFDEIKAGGKLVRSLSSSNETLDHLSEFFRNRNIRMLDSVFS